MTTDPNACSMKADITPPPRIIVITGGIGSGKSVVCTILRHMGFEIYDCEACARGIIDSSEKIIGHIESFISSAAIQSADGKKYIHRPTLAQAVFSDPEKLQRLNRLVHGEVIADIMSVRSSLTGSDRMFVETAIAHSSGLDRMADEIWLVTAPEEIRIERTMRRDNTSRSAVEARIAVQDKSERHLDCTETHTIINDDRTPLLPQIIRLAGR